MSVPLETVNHAATVDWNLVAAATATFFGTLTITVWGWFQGKKKLAARLNEHNLQTEGLPVTGAVLLDNQTIREATIVHREVRDRLLVHAEALYSNCKAVVDNTNSMDEILEELRALRKSIDKMLLRP